MIVGYRDIFKELKGIKDNPDGTILTGKQSFECVPEFLTATDICLLPVYNIPVT